MSVHILNGATMSPYFPRWHVGTPCLVVETDQGLVLVDTGLGLNDYECPSRLVRFFRTALRLAHNPEMTVVRQLARFSYPSKEVHNIILTHLHFDHAGGLPDFPAALVHVHRREYQALLHPRGLMELGYDRSDFSHGPHWVLYEQEPVSWLGFDAFRLPFTPEIYLVPLFGHTHGHCGVAIQEGNGWLFQCADALPTTAEFDLTPEWLNRFVIGPHVPRLRTWARSHPEVRLMAGHMWESFFTRKGLAPV